MTEPTSRSTRLHKLFTETVQQQPAEREAYLLRSCPDDPALVREVLALFRAAAAAPADFLTPPPPPPDPPSFLLNATPHPPAPYDPARDTLPGRRLKGRYTIQHRIGEGGMSVVYEGVQDHPHRRVAVKIMRPQFISPKVLRRFRDEPEILAQLNHPHIVRVFEADVEDFGAGDGPQPYFVMEYVDGIPMTQYARDRRLPLRKRLKLFAIVCDAVQEAHQRGIIHRDLKPSNILVTAEGEPKLLDFGVAKVLATSGMAIEHTLTGELQLIGTLQYMSPEQCNVGLGALPPRGEPMTASRRDESSSRSDGRRGLNPEPQPLNPDLPPDIRSAISETRNPIPESRVPSLDTRSDVYSLGILLYELLTERLPYDVSNMTIVSAARTICEAAPTPPSHFDRRLRGDLDAIILKALEKNRADRYASAAHLEDDVRRYLSGEPTTARPATWRTRTMRWMQRHPKLATAAIAFFAGVLAWIPAMLAWEWGFQRGVEGVSLRFHRAFNETAVELKSFDGRTLAVFDAGSHGQTPVAEVLDSSRAGGRDVRVVVGQLTPAPSDVPGKLVVYRWNQPKQALEPVWERHEPDPGPLPNPHGRDYSLKDFWFRNGCVADIFDNKESKGDEIVAVFSGKYTQSVLQIHDLDGQLLYRIWADVQISDILWQAESRLLICYGHDGSAFGCAREGIAEKLDIVGRHAKVVFAFRPELGKIHDDTFLCLEPELIPGTIAPAWCRMFGPWHLVDACLDDADLYSIPGRGFSIMLTLKGEAASLGKLRIEVGRDGTLLKVDRDADNVKSALARTGADSTLSQFVKNIDLLPHPPIRNEWIPIEQKKEGPKRLYYLRDCELDPAGGPPITHSTTDCPLNAYGVHGSPYRWARLLRDRRGDTSQSE